nr:LptA/OstA family protein [Shimia biformata]
MKVAFGGLAQDPDAPVEVTADSLVVNQEDGSATFTGNVVIAQGTLRMSAPKVAVFYNEDTQGVSRLVGSGGVLIVNGDDAAESSDASYDVDGQMIEMTGGVLLTQKLNTISADRMTVNLRSNSAEMHGRVKTVLKSGEN